MEDKAIIDLYFARSERAISETSVKYGGFCYSIAYNILSNREDSEESVNDTYLAAWNNIPPRHPAVLGAFLGKMTRYISLNRWKHNAAKKRGGGSVELALEELEACVSAGDATVQQFARKEITRCVNRVLEGLPKTERQVFMCRYWYLDSLEVICANFGFSESKVKSMLHRTRGKLRRALEEEGLV